MRNIDLKVKDSPESNSERMAFDDFYARYCAPDGDVKHEFRGEMIDFEKVLFYGRTDDTIIIQRGGVHQNQLIHWMASYDLRMDIPIFYDIGYMYYSLDPNLQEVYGANKTIINHVAAPKGYPSERVQLRMGSHVLEWVQGGIAEGVLEL